MRDKCAGAGVSETESDLNWFIYVTVLVFSIVLLTCEECAADVLLISSTLYSIRGCHDYI